uniref:RING-type domain-containing protein n=1 Tax=Chromera velia CCMP2878 TaxID=1169474 RepID=A0A0G4IDD0_9ALVE|eukprot:Cvel_13315.t1-p1 / transcript=Cvel_13315.t1 / gene=Cvel_13315 / organism=Chromera_velia_CCMP2878 / gene_product=Immediate-early protein 2, putative / transcript_product=Immediate-early protein 2, putative / location=Cvel_scaffold903:54677-57508(-) / protein_length=571 / sequence_SO=supercontig / SO=protein_coding / is_pseudo=false
MASSMALGGSSEMAALLSRAAQRQGIRPGAPQQLQAASALLRQAPNALQHQQTGNGMSTATGSQQPGPRRRGVLTDVHQQPQQAALPPRQQAQQVGPLTRPQQSQQTRAPTRAHAKQIGAPSRQQAEQTRVPTRAHAQQIGAPSRQQAEQTRVPTRAHARQIGAPSRQQAEQTRAPTRAHAHQMGAPSRQQGEQTRVPTRAHATQIGAPSRQQAEQTRAPTRAHAQQIGAPSQQQAEQTRVPTRAHAHQMGAPSRQQAEQTRPLVRKPAFEAIPAVSQQEQQVDPPTNHQNAEKPPLCAGQQGPDSCAVCMSGVIAGRTGADCSRAPAMSETVAMMGEDGKTFKLSCGHEMHRGCARKWFLRCLGQPKRSATCPVCRQPQKDAAALAEIGVHIPAAPPALPAVPESTLPPPPAHLPPWPPGPDGLPEPLSRIGNLRLQWDPKYRHPVTIRPDKRTLFGWGAFSYVNWNMDTFTEAWPRKDPSSWRFRWQREARLTDSNAVHYFDQWGFPHFYKHNVIDLPQAETRWNRVYEVIQAAQNTIEMFFQGVCYRLCDLWHTNDPAYRPLPVPFLP